MARDYLLLRGESDGRVDAFSRGTELLEAVRRNGGYDVYLMDILMPGISGVDTVQELRGTVSGGEIIFLSSVNDFAADSYSVGAFYYLLKPVDRARLFDVLDRAVNKLRRSASCVVVSTRGGMRRVMKEDILYVERRGRALRYVLAGDMEVESTTIRGSLREACAPLLSEEDFYLCGASYVINLRRVTGVERQSAIFDTGESIDLPRTAASDFKEAWGEFWLGGGGLA